MLDLKQSYDAELPVDWIRPNPDNPNEGDEKALEDSIDNLGWFGAILVREVGECEYELLGGEHRWKDTKKRGGKTIPALIMHDVDDERALKILLNDNEITRRGGYNHAKLNKVIKALPDLKGVAFTLETLEQFEEHRLEQEAAAALEAAEACATNPLKNAHPKEFEREYGIVINCESEEEQEAFYQALLETLEIAPEKMRVVSI